ncbi:hypothetical protein [Lysinibacillus sp. FSL P2-0066]
MLIKQTLLWNDSASAKSGVFMLNESPNENFVKEADFILLEGQTSVEMEE